MGINLGATAISDVKLGNSQVSKLYLGNTEIWASTPPPAIKALKFSSASAQTLGINTAVLGTMSIFFFEYSTDGGATWTEWHGTNPSLTIPFGNGIDLYLRGSNSVLATTGNNYVNFVFSTNSPVYCSGNIMHLFDYTQDLTAFPWNNTADRGVKNMFNGCTQLVTAPSLPAMKSLQGDYTLPVFAYYQMFYGCTSLTVPPALPSTIVDTSTYDSMFYGCTSLSSLPRLSHLISVNTDGLNRMFMNCSSIKMSETQVGEYANEYSLSAGYQRGTDMFTGTGGTFTGTPTTTLYYTANAIVG